MTSLNINEINNLLKGELIGSTNEKINGPEQIEKAEKNHITFIGSKKYLRLWETSKASAVIVDETFDIEPGNNRAVIKVKNADLAIAKLLEAFDPGPPKFDVDIHPSAVIDSSAKVGTNCKIGAGSYVGKNVELAEGVILYPNTTVLDNTTIGKGTIVWSGTVIRERFCYWSLLHFS